MFTSRAMLVIHAYGLFLAVPVIAAALVMSVSSGSFLSISLPIVALAFTAAFLPFGLGNAYIIRLVCSRDDVRTPEPHCPTFIVQLTVQPRIQSGLRALIEDADDIGRLTLTPDELHFEGDSLTLRIPWAQVTHSRNENTGLRTLFVYGQRMSVGIAGVDGLEVLEFAERSSLLLWRSRATAREMKCAVMEHVNWGDSHAGNQPSV